MTFVKSAMSTLKKVNNRNVLTIISKVQKYLRFRIHQCNKKKLINFLREVVDLIKFKKSLQI